VYVNFEQKFLLVFLIATAIDANASAMGLRQLALRACERAELISNCYKLTVCYALAVEIRPKLAQIRCS